MILLKANLELKSIFLKMINTMGENVKWTEIFVVNNNDIILAGEGRSLFFNFDNRRAFSNIVELPVDVEKAERIIQNPLLENTLNMILYVFGKWGGIKGLKVEMNYEQLNGLLNNILEEISIECVLTSNNFRFFKDGILITYEEVVQEILDKSKPEDDEDSQGESAEEGTHEEESEEKQEEVNEYELGLWHKICWIDGKFAFDKEELTESDRIKSRLGNNFYMVNYKCPDCGEKLYMVVYPPGKEFRIETDEEAVYMARAYTCSECNTFYTPRPHKLLIEGEVFTLDFEDDRQAYQDYLELLGKNGEKTSNSNFNVFETEYNSKEKENSLQLEEICEELDSLSVEGILELKDKMDSGFYPPQSVRKFLEKVDGELVKRKNRKDKKEKKKVSKEKKEPFIEFEDISKKESVSAKKSAIRHIRKSEAGKYEKEDKLETRQIQPAENQSDNEEKKNNRPGGGFNLKAFGRGKEILAAQVNGEHDFFAGAVEKLSSRQLADLKLMIQSEQGIGEDEKKKTIDKIEGLLYKEKEKELLQKSDSGKEKSYVQILKLVREIEEEDCAESIKKPILKSLMELLKKRGERELESIILQLPENISRKQYKEYKEKIEQYKEIDRSSYKNYLDEKRDTAEKREISAFIKRADAKDRKSLSEVYEKLKNQGYEDRNVRPFLETIYDKIHAIDEKEIKKIFPGKAESSFEEGLKAYEEISSGNFLPELKLNVLGTIDKRLKKMKMEECEQLVKKLYKEMEPVVKDYSRIYFFDVRKMLEEGEDSEYSQIVNNALNAYGTDRGEYEYPILICDASFSANGGSGFVLTPDHIFYNGLLNTGTINIMDIEEIWEDGGLFGKGIYVNEKNAEKSKILNSAKLGVSQSFAAVLNDFVSYLKEKPESRNVSYMAKEKHTVKCCYRCGYIYKGGEFCPKCGSKSNI